MVGARKSIHNVEEGDWKTYFTHETRMPHLCLTSFTGWIMSVHVCFGGAGRIGRTFCGCEVVSVILQTQRKSFRASNDLNWQEMQSQPTCSLTCNKKLCWLSTNSPFFYASSYSTQFFMLATSCHGVLLLQGPTTWPNLSLVTLANFIYSVGSWMDMWPQLVQSGWFSKFCLAISHLQDKNEETMP